MFKLSTFRASALLLGAACGLTFLGVTARFGHAAESGRVYELRIYHTYPGKLDTLLQRFRDHTMTIFERHGMHNVAYWTPTDEPLKGHTLVYIISHESREAARRNWAAFNSDPEWQKVKAASEANGKLVEKVDSTYMEPTDFSPMK